MPLNANFRRLRLANIVSSFGTEITFLALPITAISLDASAAQMGILAACSTLPYLLLGLPAGAYVDRMRRRPILIAADVGRALLLGLIPLLVWLGLLRIDYLYAIAFATGTLSMLYDFSEEAYLPAIIDETQLVAGNSQLAAIDSTAELVAPALGGTLIELLTAPFAIAVDALSFLWSGYWLSRISKPEPAPTINPDTSVWQDIKEGMAFLIGHNILRASVLTGFQWQLFGGINDALLVLFLVETLGLNALAIGLMYAVGSLSALLLTPFVPKISERLGRGRTAVLAATLLGSGWLFVSLAQGSGWRAFAWIAGAMLFAGAGNMLWNVTIVTITQTLTPNRMLGRVNASGRALTWGALPLGAFMGGLLGEQFGLRPIILLAGIGLFTGSIWVWLSPLRLKSATD